MAQGEVESLPGSLAFIKSPEVAERLKKYLAHKTMPNLSAFSGWTRNTKSRALMLIDLLEVAIADRDLAPKEKEPFHRIGKLPGFPYDQVELFIATGAKAMQMS